MSQEKTAAELMLQAVQKSLTVLKQGSTPKFEVKDLGEGSPSPDEVIYREQFQKLLKELYHQINEVSDENLTGVIDTFILNGQEIVEKHLNRIWDRNVQIGIDNLSKLGINKQKPKGTSPVKKALIEWQKYAIYRVGRQLELDIMNERLSTRYFEAAYGNDKKTT
jgi:hypothetical protein